MKRTGTTWTVLFWSVTLALLALIILANIPDTERTTPDRWEQTEQVDRPAWSLSSWAETIRQHAGTIVSIALVVGIILLIALLLLDKIARGVKQPSWITVVPLADPPDLVQEVSGYVATTTEQLTKLGFSPRLDFTAPELPHKCFLRLMIDSWGDHSAIVAEVEAKVEKSGQVVRWFVNYFEFMTILDSGTRVNTSNSPYKNVLEPLPDCVQTRYPHVTDPRDLFDIHRADVDRARMERGGRTVAQSLEQFLKDFPLRWAETMAYQGQVGLLKKSADGRTYEGTRRLILRYLLRKSP